MAAQPQVFHRARCPFCRRLRAYLAEKRIDVGLRTFHPDSDIEELRALNPKTQVPTYHDGELSLFESSIIMEYLEDTQPEPKLRPETAAGRARTRLLFDLADHLFTPSMIGFVRVPPDHPSRPEHHDDIVEHCRAIAEQLDETGPFAFGEVFTMADLSLPPLLFRCIEGGLDPDVLHQRVRVWARAVLGRPSVGELYPDVRV